MKAMRLIRLTTWLLLSGLFYASAPLQAQSLGDVAKKEEERRKAVASAGKVYTNKDLPSVPSPTTPPAAATADTRTDDASKDKKTETQADTKDKPAVKDQAYWAERKKTMQGQLDRDQTFSDALQSRINAGASSAAIRSMSSPMYRFTSAICVA